jgi:outer membrane protein assembly factor BamB
VAYVLKAGREFKLLRANRLNLKEDMCMATPAIVGGKLLIRTDARIYCFSKSKK